MPLDTSNDGVDLQRQYAADWAPSFSQSILEGWGKGFQQFRAMEGVRLNYSEAFRQQTGLSSYAPVDPSNFYETILNIGGPVSNSTNLSINNYIFTASAVAWGSLPSGSSSTATTEIVTGVTLGASEITVTRATLEIGFGVAETPGAPTSEAFAVSVRLVATSSTTIPVDTCTTEAFSRGVDSALESGDLLLGEDFAPLIGEDGNTLVAGTASDETEAFFSYILVGQDSRWLVGEAGNVLTKDGDAGFGVDYERILIGQDSHALVGEYTAELLLGD